MIEIVKHIIANVLFAMYQSVWFSLLLAILFMFLFLYAEEHGWKESLLAWWRQFKRSKRFRKIFLLVFYTMMVLFRTLFNRNMWVNPISNVIGTWGLYNENGDFTTETVENLVLFIPFVLVLLWTYQDKIIGEKFCLFDVVLKSSEITFLFSVTIEFLQLFLRLGTFQLSDLFFNTLGGMMGGFIYWFGYKVKHRKS
jgi:glycopeptide antibiotics resistance protein